MDRSGQLSEELRRLRQELYDLEDRAGYNNQALDDATREARIADVREHIELLKDYLRAGGNEKSGAAGEAVPQWIYLGDEREFADWIAEGFNGRHFPEAVDLNHAIRIAARYFLWKDPKRPNQPAKLFNPENIRKNLLNRAIDQDPTKPSRG